MSCRYCSQYNDCRKLTLALENWDEYDEDFTSTGDMVEDIEDNLSDNCEEYDGCL